MVCRLPSLLSFIQSDSDCSVSDRLLEFAQSYYDMTTFPNGETKRALLRVVNNKTTKGHQDGERKNKKRKNKTR